MADFYIVSVKWSQKRHRYISFWRPDNCGYAWPLSWAGKYDEATVRNSLDYYNNGSDTIAVPCDLIDGMTTNPVKGEIDGDAGPVVLNIPEHWRKIMPAAIQKPPARVRPECIYFGRNAA